MKKIILLLTIFFAICSCSKSDNIQEVENEEQYVEIPVKCCYEGAELINEQPLTKAATSSRDLYGIQIYNKDYNYQKSHFMAIYDDISLLETIRLVKGKTYEIRSIYVPNAKDYLEEYGAIYLRCSPFSTMGKADWNYMEINHPYYGNNDWGQLNAIGHTKGNLNNIDFYISFQKDFLATENSEIVFDYLRYNAGLRFTFEAEDDLEIDSLYVTCSDEVYDTIIPIENGEGVYEIPNMIMPNGLNSINDEDEMNVSFGVKDDLVKFFDGTIKFKRMTMRTYLLKLKANTSNFGVKTNFDDEDFTDEDMGEI